MNIIKKIKLFFLYHQRKYKKVLELTVFNETKKVDEINSSNLKYQSSASFFTKNYHHSQMCLELLKEKNQLNYFDNNLLAYIYARHNKIDKAITEWCSAQEKYKNDKISKKALDYLRKQDDTVNLRDDDFFDSLIPKEPFLIPFFGIFKVFILLILLFSLLFGVYYIIKNKKYLFNFKKIKIRNEINSIYLPDYNPNLLEKPKLENEKYSYNEKEIKNKFDRIKTLILKNNAIDAQIEINQVKMSNASTAVKLRVEMLENYIDEPDYALFENKINFSDLLSEKEADGSFSQLYQNVYITWYGRVVNLLISKDKITFDFIIGDEKKGIVEAVIPVIFKKAIIINNNDKIKVFGKIKIIKQGIYIEGKYIIK